MTATPSPSPSPVAAPAPARPARPLPVPDEVTAPFWAAAARGVLTMARCSRCGRFALPPDLVCPHCHSADPAFAFEPVTGRGVVRSWTVVRQAFLPGFAADVPYLLVDVELAEQAELRLIGRLLDGPDAPVCLGHPVRTVFESVADGVAIPAFALDGAA